MQSKQLWTVSAALVLAALVLPTTASAFIYWPNAEGSIGRANLDGSGVDNEFVVTEVSPCDVATNGTYVYWSGGEGVGFVGRAKVSTQAPEDHFIETADDLNCGVAVDGQHIYFNNYASGAIGRANLSGGSIEDTFITGGINPQHPYVTGGRIYWTNKGYGCPPGCTVGVADDDGNNVDQDLITGTHDPPSGVAADSSHVYWGNGSFVGRANLNGSGADPQWVATENFVCDVAVDDGHVYWADYGDPGPGRIGRANLDGSGIDDDFIETGGGTCGVAVDTLKPSNGFDFIVEPRITCAGICRVVLVKIEFDSDGNLVAQQILPGQERVGAARAAVVGKKSQALIATLKTKVKSGDNKLKLKLTKAGKSALKNKGKLKARMRFKYTPKGGKSKTIEKVIKIKQG